MWRSTCATAARRRYCLTPPRCRNASCRFYEALTFHDNGGSIRDDPRLGASMAERILIADDDAVARRLVENMVQKCGYETIVVDSGDAAITALTAPDAAID